MSSWDYPSFNNRRPEHGGNNALGDFERLPNRIKNGPGRGDVRRGSQLPNRNRFKPIGSPDDVVKDLPLPRRGGYSTIAVPGTSAWDSLPFEPNKKKQAGSSSISNSNTNSNHPGSSKHDVTKSKPPQVVVDLEEEEAQKAKKKAEEEVVKEELFPPNRVALLQERLDWDNDGSLIGLEYIVEVQHNSRKKMAPLYYCLLCGEKTKTLDSISASIDLIRTHIDSSPHKANYIATFFPTLKKCILNKLDVESQRYRDTLNGICKQITISYGKVNIKIVVGLELYGRRQEEIKNMIDNSTHFRESKAFVDLTLGKNLSLANSYEKIFSDFEEELRKKNSRDQHRSHDHKNTSRDRYRSRRSRSRSPRHSHDRKSSSSRNSYERGVSDHERPRSHNSPRGKDHSSEHRKKEFRRSSIDRSSKEESSSKMSQSLEKDVELFLNKEKTLNAELKRERKGYLNFPHTHRKYNEEWEKFYVEMSNKKGITDAEVINKEWIEYWKAFFFEAFDFEARRRRARLMQDHHICSRDLEQYYRLKSNSLEEQVESRLSSSRPGSSSSRSTLKDVEEDKEEVPLISTFRLMSALEGILEELGPTVVRLMGKANAMEVNDGFGSSSAMIHEEEVFTLLWKAKEKLDYKIQHELIQAGQVTPAKVCLSNMAALIKRSSCELPREPPNPKLSNEISIRASIAKTVVEQFDAQGKMITESQLASIVEMEYARVKDCVGATSTSSTPAVVEPTGPKTIELMDFKQKPEMEEEVISTPKSEEDLEKMTCKQLADIFKRFREFNKVTRCMILDYMKKIEKTNPARVTDMKKIIHSKT